MGFRILKSFLQHHPNRDLFCDTNFDIRQKAEEYREVTHKEPVIIVDGTNFLHAYYEGRVRNEYRDWDYLLGGQLRDFQDFLKNFVHRFRDINVKLIFYFEGPTPNKQMDVTVRRNVNIIKQSKSIFDEIKFLKKFNKNNVIVPQLISLAGRLMLKYECDGCDVRVTRGLCDEDLVEEKRDCFAIMSEDIGFLLLGGDRYFFPLQHLNIRTMTTFSYNRENLAQCLDLELEHLPLCGMLLCEENVTRDMLQAVHKFICLNEENRDSLTLVPMMAGFVNYITKQSQNNELGVVVANTMKFLQENLSQCSSELSRWFEINFQSYNPETGISTRELTVASNMAWTQILEEAHEKYKKCEITSDVYATVNGWDHEIEVVLEDVSSKQEASQIVYRSIRECVYGILLYERPGVAKMREWGVWLGRTHEPETVTVVKPGTIHPGLLRLWAQPTEDSRQSQIETQRWCLFACSISKTLLCKLKELRNLEFKLIVPTVVLYYLTHVNRVIPLEDWEVDVFIAQAACAGEYIALGQKENPGRRAVNLATLFCSGVTTVLFLMSALGFPLKEALPGNYFDGLLFNYMYIRANYSQTCNKLYRNKIKVMEKFNAIRSIVGDENGKAIKKEDDADKHSPKNSIRSTYESRQEKRRSGWDNDYSNSPREAKYPRNGWSPSMMK